MRRTLVGWALVAGTVIASPVLGADEQPSARDLIGRPAPELSVDEVIAGESGLEGWSPVALRGRSVVVDFWSTWCAPCVEDLPRWNAMVDELAGEPVVFLAVSDEEPEVVRKFLAERRMAGEQAVDPDRSAFEAFAVTAIPQAVLIDQQGVVRGIGHTDDVDPAMVRRLIAGEDPGLVPAPGVDELLAEVGRGEAAKAIYQVGLWPTQAGGGQVSGGAEGFVAIGVGVRVMVPFLWRASAARVVVEDDVPAGRFDLVVRPAGDGARVEALAREALQTGLGLDVRREVREVDVWLLRVAESDGQGAVSLEMADDDEEPQFLTGPGKLAGNRVRIAGLAGTLEREVRRPVVDETGLAGEYALDLTWAAGEEGALVEVVENLGFEVVAGRREVEMVVVARR
ncbi:MAG TPA: DUF3738 domain-containing protein [Thermoanaerobaculia bacterium]|nr:DUF3738 domain-containing protein [Thermoanaerobaculia bacterium]